MERTVSRLLKHSPMHYDPKEDDVIFLNLNGSDVCNYRCLKCFQGDAMACPDALDLGSLTRIVDRSKDELGIKAVYLSGRGEPFLVGKGKTEERLRDYRMLVEHINKRGVGVCQFTNGYYLGREMVDFLIDQDVSIVVSLDTLAEENYDMVFRPPKGAFQRVMDNLDYARRNFPREGDVYRLGLNTAISRVNLDEVERIRDFCGEDMIFFSNYPMIRGNFQENLPQLCSAEDEYEGFKQKCVETSAYHHLAGICQNGACGFYYNGLSVDVNGDVLLSPYDVSNGKPFGNIRDYDDLKDAVGNVRRSVRAFLERYPEAKACPLRHPEYGPFRANLDMLGKSQNASNFGR